MVAAVTHNTKLTWPDVHRPSGHRQALVGFELPRLSPFSEAAEARFTCRVSAIPTLSLKAWFIKPSFFCRSFHCGALLQPAFRSRSAQVFSRARFEQLFPTRHNAFEFEQRKEKVHDQHVQRRQQNSFRDTAANIG